MTPEEIFTAAVEIADRAAREAYLHRVFREFPGCQEEVESLLASHDQASGFLSRPAAVPPVAIRWPESRIRSGDQIGPYKIEEPLGRGGMGVVFAATQEAPVRRRVALKIIRAGMNDPRILDRFEAERQALALMDHPNIARILDAGIIPTASVPDEASTSAAGSADGPDARGAAGETGGVPYFVMELISGIPITTWADRHRLSPRQRLELMIPVCEAVQHAHQKGIIHRDIKPSNVLVTEYAGRPVPKIIDFGVAKAIGNNWTDLSIQTGFGQIVGTLEYMSPEQAGLNPQDIDTRTDIYALGVLLYELLTGSTPLNRQQLGEAAFAEVIRLIREVEPQKPSTRISSVAEAPSIAANRNTDPSRLSGFVRGDLDWIAMKALDKDRNRRYQSAHEMAADIERFLRDEPVLAGPPSRTYRLRKFFLRHRVPASLAGLAVLALIGGTVGTSLGMLRARQERNEKGLALEQVRRENEEKTRALVSEKTAREAADEATDRAVTALQTLTDEAIDRLLAAEPNLSAENRDFLEQIVSQLEDFTRATDRSVKARVVQADGLNQIGNLKGQLGDYPGAIASFRRAIEIWEPLCRERPDKPEYRRGMGDAWSNLGIFLGHEQDYSAAEQAHRKALQIHDALAAEFPDNLRYQNNAANVRNSFGVMLKDIRRNAETMVLYAEAIAIYKSILQKVPEDVSMLRQLIGVQNNYAIELHLAKKTDESIAAAKDVVAVRERLAKLPDCDPQEQFYYPMSLVNLAMMVQSAGRQDEAVSLLEQADPLSAKITADFPAVVMFRDGQANLLNLLASLYSSQQRSELVISVADRGIQLLGQLIREFPQRAEYSARQAQLYSLQAIARERQQDPAACRTAWTAAIAAAQTAVERDGQNPDFRFQLANLHVFAAHRLERAGDSETARNHWKLAQSHIAELLNQDPQHAVAQKLQESIPQLPDNE